MTKKELEAKVKQLENMVELLNEMLDIYRKPNIFPTYKADGDCPMGGWHEYPNPWHSITSPFCKKCGQQAPDTKITYTASV